METKPIHTPTSATPFSDRAAAAKQAITDSARSVADDVKTAAHDVEARASDLAERARSAAAELRDEVPKKLTDLAHATDRHVHEHPRMDLVIVAGASALAGAFMGRKLAQLVCVGACAYAVAKLYPQIDRALRQRGFGDPT